MDSNSKLMLVSMGQIRFAVGMFAASIVMFLVVWSMQWRWLPLFVCPVDQGLDSPQNCPSPASHFKLQAAGAAKRMEMKARGSATAYLKAFKQKWDPLPSTNSCISDSSVSPPLDKDILVPEQFMRESKNPCWPVDASDTKLARPSLHCLPYFFLAGVSKCGTTDIFNRLCQHPQVVLPQKKEPSWFDRRRFDMGYRHTFQWYLSNFQTAEEQIAKDIESQGGSSKIIGDGSPTYFWRNLHWAEYPRNEGCVEPRVVTPDIIHNILPAAKIILSFRNPVDTLYSKYLSEADKGKLRSPQHFHFAVEEAVHQYEECFAQHSLRRCAYNVTLSSSALVRLEKGMYWVFLGDWLRVFPRRQIHVIRFEDYVTDIAGSMGQLFSFLQLSNISRTDLAHLAFQRPSNTGRHYDVGDMLPSTASLLRRFYAPFNRRLATMLRDDRFLWTP